jgi:hypothetical protein
MALILADRRACPNKSSSHKMNLPLQAVAKCLQPERKPHKREGTMFDEDFVTALAVQIAARINP